MNMGEVDVFITSSTFFTGIFLNMLQKLHEAGECPNVLCSLYGVSLAMTSVFWSFLAAVSILYRLHYNEGVNYIVIAVAHMLMRSAVVMSMISINLNVWNSSGASLGPVAGLISGWFVSIMTIFLVVFYVYDYALHRHVIARPIT